MKIILILIFIFNILVKSLTYDECGPIIIDKVKSCNTIPSSIKIQNSLVNISTVEITPSVKPIYDIDSISFNLVDGIEYTISYQNLGCTNKNNQVYIPDGMYYQLSEQPKCRNSVVNLNLYNYNNQLKSYLVQHGIQSFSDDNGCTISAFIYAKNTSSYPSPNDIKVSHSMCGFSNGTITINTLVYSSIYLTLNGNQIKSNLSGYYSGLIDGTYRLQVYSSLCGNESIPIEIKKVYSQMKFGLVDFKSYGDNATMSFGFPSNRINSSIANIYLVNENVIPSNEWSGHRDIFSINTFIYGFKYNYDLSPISTQSSNMCKQTERIYTDNIRPNVDFTINKPSSCKDNVTISFNSNYQNDTLSIESPKDVYTIVNNKVSAPYNSYLIVKSNKGSSNIYIDTTFKEIKYQIIEITNDTDCWKQYNITVLNYQLYETLRIESNNHGHGYVLYPVNGVFTNVASNRLKLIYRTSDCETESYIFILDQLSSPVDRVSINYSIKSNSTCTQDATVEYTLNTPLGIYTGEFKTSSSLLNYYFMVPNSYCYYVINYHIPTFNIVDDLQVSIDDCTGTALSINSTYQLVSLTSNGQDITNTLQVNSLGENKIVAHFKNGAYQCYSSKTINIVEKSSGANITITPVDDCLNTVGSVKVENYKDYESISLEIKGVDNTMTDGFISTQMGEFILKIQTSSCLYKQKVIVGGNIIPTITTTTIREPTCNDSGIGDGLIMVSLSTINYGEMNNFDIIDGSGSVYSNRMFTAGTTGENTLNVRFYNCLWTTSHNLSSTINDPLIGLDFNYNSTDCIIKNIYKVITNNSNVNIQTVSNLQYANSLLYNQLNYYITNINDNSEFVTYDVNWNNHCKKNFKTTISKNVIYNNIMGIQVNKPNDCSSNKMDIIITNMNLFVSGSVLILNKQPTYINSTHSIFKDLIATEGFISISYTLLNGCSSYSGVSLPNGITSYPINYTVTNEVCYSSNARVKIDNFDTSNYYYRLLYKGLANGETDFIFNSNGEVSGLSSSNSYQILRVSKYYGNCKTLQQFSISKDEPKIDSIIVVNPSNQDYNNGSIQVVFNFIPTLVTYQVITINSEGSVSSNDFIGNTLMNVPPGTYQIKATIKDSPCPVTLTSELITVQFDSPSSSNIIKFNILIIIISVISIIIL